MAKSINKVELLGRVGADPEMRYTASGIAVTQLRLATDRVRKGGESETDWHSVVVWDKLAEACANYVEKGQRLYVAGRLAQNSWTGDDGQRRYRTEIHAQEVVFLDSARNGGNGDTGHASWVNSGASHQANAGNANGIDTGGGYQPGDEDSPF